ncbi:class I SAM-dependent methyltransferase [Tepidamorphus sp. 3E244]|uniref:class I SAM-dependent methyltransferase n=1 Tax=Tepidamorphus sp. 3E244 TaxID=3385498 RepID=UPI0038FC7E50
MSRESTDISQAFDAVAASYDASRKRLVPCFDAFYGAAVSACVAAMPDGEAPRVTDLGAGTGLLAALVSHVRPDARFTLIDVAGAMIDEARARFARLRATASFRVEDYADHPLPDRQDAFLSALSIHHLGDADKAALFARIALALRPGGIFVNAEQVAPEPPATMNDVLKGWEDDVRRAGGSEDELVSARKRMAHDQCAPLSAQLDWLREAGFEAPQVHFSSGIFAVYSAQMAAHDAD